MANRYLPEDPSSWGPSEKEIEEFPYKNRGSKPPALAQWQAFAAPWQKRAEARGFADPFAMIGRDIAAAERDQQMRETEARMQAEIEREIGVPGKAARPAETSAQDNPSARPDDVLKPATRSSATPILPTRATHIGFTKPPPQKTLLGSQLSRNVNLGQSPASRTEIESGRGNNPLLHLTRVNRSASEGKGSPRPGHLLIQDEPDMTQIGDHLETRPPPVTFEPDSAEPPERRRSDPTTVAPISNDAVALDRKYRKIAHNHARNFPLAAALLRHFLDGQGGTARIDPNWLRTRPEVEEAERSTQRYVREWLSGERLSKQRTEEGRPQLGQQLLRLKDGESMMDEEPWDGVFSGSVFNDVWWALGNSSFKAIGRLQFTRRGDEIHFEGEIRNELADKYDWREGDGLLFKQSELVKLQNEGKARPFMMRSQWRQPMRGRLKIDGTQLSIVDFILGNN